MDTIWVYYPNHSWHALKTFTRTGSALTLCGKTIGGPGDEPETSDDLPAEKSCETCLRILAREADE